MTTLADLVDERRVVICCGTGGVGKTTTAAALALAAAKRGRRAAVVTIDPARRLANAMGLEEIGNECHQVPGFGPGELWATMLDTKATFDVLIVQNAKDPGQAERILTNRYYRNLSSTLSGTREYMAAEKLYQLAHDNRFDLVVVDTPPSRNALDFLEAPERLRRFLDGRLFRMAMPGRRVLRTMTAPFMAFLRRVAKAVSPEVVDDTLAFLEAFAGMEEGFRHRAAVVDELLVAPETAYVVISSPSDDAVVESCYFVDRLGQLDITVDGLVVNRMHPRLPGGSTAWLDELDDPASPLAPYVEAARDLALLAEAEARELVPLIEACPDVALCRVPLLDHDVHDLAGIAEIAARLMDDDPDALELGPSRDRSSGRNDR